MRKFIFLFFFAFSVITQLSAQDSRTVTGKITDSKGAGIAGVSVLLKGTTVGVLTDADGNYKITVPSTGKVLVFSSLNYDSKEASIGNGNVSVSLVSKDDNLSEVVVTSFGIKRDKKTLGYSTPVI
jgi:hypothetical protein